MGYNRGYRAGWQTILGNFPADVFEDNSNPWSGDHCMDYTLVPGVLLSNRPIDAASPALTDIAPTIFAEFGIPKPRQYDGTFSFLDKICFRDVACYVWFWMPPARRRKLRLYNTGVDVAINGDSLCPRKKSRSKASCWKKLNNVRKLPATRKWMNSYCTRLKKR